jgi:hypothetical protein
MSHLKEVTKVDILNESTYDKVLSKEAQSMLEEADKDFGYHKENGLKITNKPTHELRVFAVLSLLTVESKIYATVLKRGFCSREVKDRHGLSKCTRTYKNALDSLADTKLVNKDNGHTQRYYIADDVELGPAFDVDTEEELENLVVANENDTKKPQYIGTLLPGMGEMIDAAGNKQLAESPVAIAKAALSVGVALSLVGVLQFATPGVVPSMDFLEGIWLLFSFGIAATIGGLLQRGDVWLQTHRTTSLQ